MVEIRPEVYAGWRHTALGAITERVERNLILELAGPLENKRVLDVGTGDGTYALAAAQCGARVTAVDTSDAMLAAARRRATGEGLAITFQRGDTRALPFDASSFEVVLAVTVLCFVDDAAEAAGQMARVLVPGGRLVVGELGRFSPWAAWRRLRGWLGSATWRHARFRSARELVRLVTAAGLYVEAVRGAVYYPPVGLAARLLAPIDRRLTTFTTVGAAFLALAATRIPASEGVST